MYHTAAKRRPAAAMRGCYATFVAFFLLVNCKPSGGSNVKSLENFAAGSKVHENDCSAAPGPARLQSVAAFHYEKILQYDESTDSQVVASAFNALTAVPLGVLGLATRFGLKVTLTKKTNNICSNFYAGSGGSNAEILAKGSSVGIESCYIFQPKKGTSPQYFEILINPDAAAIRHGLVRQVAYVFSQLLARVRLNEDGHPEKGFIFTDYESPAFVTAKWQTTTAYLKDLSRGRFFDYSSVFGVLGLNQAKNAPILQATLNDTKATTAVFDRLAQNLLWPANLSSLDRIRKLQQLSSFVYAEAFDSYYCNDWDSYDDGAVAQLLKAKKPTLAQMQAVLPKLKNTRTLMRDFFPQTFLAFVGTLPNTVDILEFGANAPTTKATSAKTPANSRDKAAFGLAEEPMPPMEEILPPPASEPTAPRPEPETIPLVLSQPEEGQNTFFNENQSPKADQTAPEKYTGFPNLFNTEQSTAKTPAEQFYPELQAQGREDQKSWTPEQLEQHQFDVKQNEQNAIRSNNEFQERQNQERLADIRAQSDKEWAGSTLGKGTKFLGDMAEGTAASPFSTTSDVFGAYADTGYPGSVLAGQISGGTGYIANKLGGFASGITTAIPTALARPVETVQDLTGSVAKTNEIQSQGTNPIMAGINTGLATALSPALPMAESVDKYFSGGPLIDTHTGETVLGANGKPMGGLEEAGRVSTSIGNTAMAMIPYANKISEVSGAVGGLVPTKNLPPTGSLPEKIIESTGARVTEALAPDQALLQKTLSDPATSTSQKINDWRNTIWSDGTGAYASTQKPPLVDAVTGLPSPKGGWKTFDEFAEGTKSIFGPGQEAEQRLGWDTYNKVVSADKTPILGRFDDTNKAIAANPDAYHRLALPEGWTPTINDLYVKGLIDRGQPIPQFTPLTREGLTSTNKAATAMPAVTAFETAQMKKAGWTFNGTQWTPPN